LEVISHLVFTCIPLLEMVSSHVLFLATASLVAAVPLSPRAEVVFDIDEVAANTSPLDKQLISLSIEYAYYISAWSLPPLSRSAGAHVTGQMWIR
jgi:hypothetical protein